MVALDTRLGLYVILRTRSRTVRVRLAAPRQRRTRRLETRREARSARLSRQPAQRRGRRSRPPNCRGWIARRAVNAQHIRRTASTGCSPNSYATTSAHPRADRRRTVVRTARWICADVGFSEGCSVEANSASASLDRTSAVVVARMAPRPFPFMGYDEAAGSYVQTRLDHLVVAGRRGTVMGGPVSHPVLPFNVDIRRCYGAARSVGSPRQADSSDNSHKDGWSTHGRYVEHPFSPAGNLRRRTDVFCAGRCQSGISAD